jgi:tetratricopeptide (TPR) repeat protein
MAEEIITSPEESVSMDAPIVESPVEIQEEVVDVEPTPPVNSDGADNLKKLHKILAADELYSRIVPADFNEFLSNYSDVSKIQKLHKILAADELYGRIMPSDINEAADKYGFGGLGKPSAVPSKSVSGGSATKGRGVEQPSTLQPRKASEVEQSVMGYGLPKTIDIGGGKANVEEEELRLPKEAEFATIEKKIPTKEQKLEEAVRLGTPPVERVTKDITQNKNNLLSTEKELKKVEQELSGYKQQSDSLLAIYNNESLSPQERNKAGQEYNKVNEIADPLTEKYNNLANNYNGYIANEKVLFGDLDKAEKMRQKGLEKEYSHLLNLTQSVGRDLVKTVSGMTKMGFTLNDLIPNFGLITPEQEQAGKKALFEGLEATNKFAEKLITQETPENYKKIFEGDFSLGKLAYITTNAVSSTAPTVAAGLLTGGIGSVAAGAGLGFEESKSIMKDAGLSDEQSDWAAMGLAIPIGLLEKYGADDVVRLLNGSGIRRQVASELAKKIAGKTLSREAIFLEAKKTFGEVINLKLARY